MNAYEFNADYTETSGLYTRMLAHAEVWGPNATVMLPKNALKLRAEVLCTVLSLDPDAKPHDFPPMLADGRAPPMKYRRMYDFLVGRDFKLISEDESERKVHKFVLASSSPVFKNMLESNLEECQTGRCVISDMSTIILDEMLRFMYHVALENDKTNAKELLKAADKYEINDLKELCEKLLIDELDMDNVVGLLLLAEPLTAVNLKNAGLKFLVANSNQALKNGIIKEVSEASSSLIVELLEATMKLMSVPFLNCNK